MCKEKSGNPGDQTKLLELISCLKSRVTGLGEFFAFGATVYFFVQFLLKMTMSPKIFRPNFVAQNMSPKIFVAKNMSPKIWSSL
jgi:hypothetical protein